MFRAIVKRPFEVPGRGTFVAVDILEGRVASGDRILIPLADGTSRPMTVQAVEFIDRDIGKPSFSAEIALRVLEVRPDEVACGQEIRSSQGD